MPNMRNLQWDLAPTRWAYNFSTVSALFLLLGALYMKGKQNTGKAQRGTTLSEALGPAVGTGGGLRDSVVVEFLEPELE